MITNSFIVSEEIVACQLQVITLQATISSNWLSNCLQPILLFRYDLKRQEIFIIAGNNGTIKLTIDRPRSRIKFPAMITYTPTTTFSKT